MVLVGPHAPTSECDGCRTLFDDCPPAWYRRVLSTTHWRAGWSTVVERIGATTPVWLRRSRGQAIVETALVLPLLLFVLMATLEAGSLGARMVGYQQAAGAIAAGVVGVDLPGWWAEEAAAAGCVAAAAVVVGAHVRLACTYVGLAINGFSLPVTVEARVLDEQVAGQGSP
jgi:nitrate reductase gamma subunit